MKPKYMIWLECLALVLVGAIAPALDAINGRSWSDMGSPTVVLGMILGGANAAKAFFSSAAEQLREK